MDDAKFEFIDLELYGTISLRLSNVSDVITEFIRVFGR